MIKNKTLLIFLAFIIFNVTLDLVVKAWVESKLVKTYDVTELHDDDVVMKFPAKEKNGYEVVIAREIVVINNFWNLFYTRNYNIGFSSLRFLENYFSSISISYFLNFFQFFGVLIIIAIFYSYNFKYKIPFNLILSGGIGNVIDRFYRGYVVDYMKWYIPNSPFKILNPWPIFNIADIYVSIGGSALLIIIIMDSFKEFRQTKKQTKK